MRVELSDGATTMQLDPETERRLDLLVSETGRSKAFYRRELTKRNLEDIEDYYLAMAVLERVRQGEEKVHSSSEVRKALGLDD
ncbi:MAG: CopG family transcriptional regulator [Gemmatimonadetes bacterium]|nr:CopG family transcriptional regulator [Gemmatimonadota bacterium]